MTKERHERALEFAKIAERSKCAGILAIKAETQKARQAAYERWYSAQLEMGILVGEQLKEDQAA